MRAVSVGSRKDDGRYSLVMSQGPIPLSSTGVQIYGAPYPWVGVGFVPEGKCFSGVI
jgi:hypothetical protein